MDATGKEIIVKDYLDAFPFFTKDLATGCFRDKNRKLQNCKVFDRSGNIVADIPGPVIGKLGKGKRALYKIAKPFVDPQSTGERSIDPLQFTSRNTISYEVGVVDSSYKPVMKGYYDNIFCTRGCRLLVGVKKERNPPETERTRGYNVPVEQHDYVLFDRSGEEMLQLAADALVTGLDDEEHLKRAFTIPQKSRAIPYLRKDQWGLISFSGRRIIKPSYTFLNVVNSKVILASYTNKPYDAKYNSNTSGWILMDNKGKQLDITFKEVRAREFYETGHLIAYSDTACYLYQPDDNVVTIPDCQKLKVMLDKKVVAFRRGAKWGMADFKGKVIVKPTWDNLGGSYDSTRILYPFPFTSFTKGLLVVAGNDKSGTAKYGAINAKGEVKVPLEWDFLTIRGDTIWVQKGTLWGTVDNAGKQLVAPKHAKIPANSGTTADCTLEKLRCQKNATLSKAPGLFFYRRRDATFVYSAKTEKKVYGSPVSGYLNVSRDDCDLSAHKKADSWPISLPHSKMGSRKALIGTKGLVTPFKYSSLGCINHGLIPFSIEKFDQKRTLADEKKKEAATKKTETVWPAPHMPKLVKLLTALRKANKGAKDARAILVKAIPKLEKMETIKFPEKGEAKIIELRSGPNLHGALVMVCARSGDLCKPGCEKGLAIKEYKGDFGVKEISAEAFAGKLHRVEFAPEFPTTKALFVRYDLSKGSECSKGKLGEWGDSAERSMLMKVARRRMVVYRTLTMYNREVKRKISWHKGKDGTWYMGIATTYDYNPNAGQTPKLEVSLLVIPKKGYWQSKKGKYVDKLRESEPALKSLGK